MLFSDVRESILQDYPEVLKKVPQGFLIAFSDNPLSQHRCPIKFACHNREGDLQGAKKKLLSAAGIEEVVTAFYSRLFLVPKPDGTFRPIIDLKVINRFCRCAVLPDGNPVLHDICHMQSGMGYQDRPERRLPSYYGTPQYDEIFPFCGEFGKLLEGSGDYTELL